MKKNNKKNNRGYFYFIFVLFCFIVSISLLFVDYYTNRGEKILWGKSTSDFKVSYKVYNNDDKFYDEEYFSQYGSYISSITDRIDFDIDYYFNTTENLNIDYTYDIYGEVLAEVYESGKSSAVWSEELDINMESSENLGNANNLHLNKRITIPFKKYNDKMIEYKSNYNLNVSSYIKFTINVKIDSLASINSNISNNDTLTIKIPLLQPTFFIDTNKSVTNNRDIYLLTETDNNRIFLKFGIFGLIFSIVSGFAMFVFYKYTMSRSELYNVRLNNILKKYEEIIIKVDELPNVDGLELIVIKDFNDLIDLEETLKVPIIFYENISNRKGYFIIIYKNYLYKYVISI